MASTSLCVASSIPFFCMASISLSISDMNSCSLMFKLLWVADHVLAGVVLGPPVPAQKNSPEDVVMRLPAWHAAHDEVRGHIAAARGHADDARTPFGTAAMRFREAAASDRRSAPRW